MATTPQVPKKQNGKTNGATERTSLVLARISGGADGMSLVTTRQSYRTIAPAPGRIDAVHECIDKIRRFRDQILEELRNIVPRQARLQPIVDIVYDEGPGRHYLIKAYYKLENALRETHKPLGEPDEVSLHEFIVKLCHCMAVVDLVHDITTFVQHQRRAWFINTRRYSYPLEATDMVDTTSDYPLGPPLGYMRHYTLWVNDLVLRVEQPLIWKQRETFFRGRVPDHVRNVVPSPRSDITNTDSMSTVETDDDEETLGSARVATEAGEDEEEEAAGDRVLENAEVDTAMKSSHGTMLV